MDSLKLTTAWQSSLLSGECIQLSNIQIQGAIFDGQIRAVAANSPPFSPVSNATIAWIPMISFNWKIVFLILIFRIHPIRIKIRNQ